MKVLVLGGTRFFGKQAVKHMLAAGYEVTIATRGLQKDEFGDQVERISVDRTDKEALAKVLEGRSFDATFDNICYAPDEVRSLLDCMGSRMGRYIVTSSLAVYDKGLNHVEENFNPFAYPVQEGGRAQFSYGEGKRLVEAAAYQEYQVPTVALRFPVVIGEHDYTRRLAFYVNHIEDEIEFVAANNEEKMSFITEDEAAAFICSMVTSDFVGPINVASDGDITVKEIIGMIEKQAQKKARLVEESEQQGPYSTFGNVTLNTSKAIAVGQKARPVAEAFEEIIAFDLAIKKADK